MAIYRSERYSNQRVEVDGNQYEFCEFNSCQLVYSGGEKPVFRSCTFRQTGLQLDGAAIRTAQYLQNLRSVGLTYGTERILNEVEAGNVPQTGRPVSPPAVYTGRNYGHLALYSAILSVIAILLGAALWYGYYYYPNNVLLNSDPAQPLFSTPLLELYPVLPEDLALSYDVLQVDQIERLNSFGWVDREEGTVHIPIDTAISLISEQGIQSLITEGD